MADASPAGHVLVDWEAYLPRCAEADVLNQITFHTKPEFAHVMLERAVSWGTGRVSHG